MADDDDLGDFYLTHRKLIEKIIRILCREFQFRHDQCEDFAQDARLRLIDPDAGIVRKFQGRSSLETYLYVSFRRMAIDRCGGPRWRPSAAARRGGAPAERLERLLIHDRIPIDEALAMVLREFPDADVTKLKSLAERFPEHARREFVVDAILDSIPDRGAGAEDALIDAERQARLARVKTRLDELLKTIPDQDLLLLQLHFLHGLRIAGIARMWNEDQKQLYRRLQRILRRLRDVLRAEGFDLKDEDLGE